jgi:hypothetical protein
VTVGAALSRAILLCTALSASLAGADKLVYLIGQLGHASVKVRLQATFALGRLGDLRAASALVAALGDPEEPVRAAAALGLGRMGGVVAETLRRAAGDASEWVRKEATRALASLAAGAAPATEPLPPPAGAEAKAAARPQVVLQVDDSYHFDQGPPPKSDEERCTRSLRALPKNLKAGKRGLYELAWKIPGESREEAVEVVHAIVDPSANRLEEAERCCTVARSGPARLRDLFGCIAAALGQKK